MFWKLDSDPQQEQEDRLLSHPACSGSWLSAELVTWCLASMSLSLCVSQRSKGHHNRRDLSAGRGTGEGSLDPWLQVLGLL